MGIQLKCFSEIISIGYTVYRSQNLPLFRSLSWFFLVTANYYINGEMIIDQFGVLLQKTVSQQSSINIAFKLFEMFTLQLISIHTLIF